MSRRVPMRPSGRRSSSAPTAPTCPLWVRARREAGGPVARARSGRRPRRPASGRRRPRGDRGGARPDCRASSSGARPRAASPLIGGRGRPRLARRAAPARRARARDRPAARDPDPRRSRPGPRCSARLARAARARRHARPDARRRVHAARAPARASTQILPDMRELDGWVYSSEPLWVQVGERRAHRPPPARERLPRRRAWSATSTTRSSTASTPRRSSSRRRDAGLHPDGQAPDQLRRPNEADSIVVLLEARHERRTCELRLLALYPEQMNIYADRGNILFLQRRCEWRGHPVPSTRPPGPGEGFDPAEHDLIYIGGGQDRDQVLVAEDMLRTKRDAIASAVEDGAALLAVCGGYQLLGHSYQLGERVDPGPGDRRPRDGPRAGPAPDRQRLDRGRPRRRARGAGRLREPRRPHLPRPGRGAARPGAARPRQQRQRRPRGRPARST